MKLSVKSFGASSLVRALTFAIWFSTAALMLACTEETAEQDGRAENSTANGKDPQKGLSSKQPPLRVRVVVPYAGNMPGFMNYRAPMGTPPTEFQRRVGGLLTALGKAPIKGIEPTFVTTDGAGRLTPSSYAELAALVDGTRPRPQYAPGLAVPPLLADAVAAFDKDTTVVTVLVTDLTHNGGHPTSLSSLPQDVTAALIGPRGPAPFSVYAEPSRFVGTYFPAMRSAPKKGTATSIPYYIWLIGKPSQISRVSQRFLPNPPARQAHVGLTYKVKMDALLIKLPTDGKLANSGEGTVYPLEGDIVLEDVQKGVEFSLGLNLQELPTAWQEPTFLNKALQLRLPGSNAKLVANAVRRLTNAERANSVTLRPYTHAARVRLSSLTAPAETLTLTLPAPELPAWPGEWTSAIDQPPGLTTYRVKQMLEGARRAHGAGALPAVFSASLSLKQEE